MSPISRFIRFATQRAVFIATCVVLAAVAGNCATASTAEPALGTAPEFTVRTLDGQEISRASLAGKVVVINFWATWCSDCAHALPVYRALQTEFAGEKDFVFIGVSLDERPAEFVRKFSEKNQINYLVAMGDESLPRAFGGISEIPTTFVLDRTGTIRHRHAGSIALADFEQLIRSLL